MEDSATNPIEKWQNPKKWHRKYWEKKNAVEQNKITVTENEQMGFSKSRNGANKKPYTQEEKAQAHY